MRQLSRLPDALIPAANGHLQSFFIQARFDSLTSMNGAHMPNASPRMPRNSTSQPPRAFSFALALCVALLSVAPAVRAETKKPEPDVVVFTNGDQLTGTVERGMGDSIVFKSDMAGEITISFAKIKELRSHGAFAVLRKDTKTPTTNVQEGTIAYSDGKVTLTNPATTETVAPKDVAFIIDKNVYDKQVLARPGLLTGWKGAVTGGATFVRSTNNGSTFTAATTLVRAIPLVSYLPPKSKSIFDLSETYGKLTQPVIPQTAPPSLPNVAKTDIFHSDFEQDRYFSPRFYALGHTSFDHNFSQGLRLQQLYGLGAGWTPIQNPRQQLDLKADIHYEKQNFEPPTVNENLVGSTLAEFYHRNLPHKIVFTESADILPAFNQTNDYSADASLGLVLPTYKRLAVSFNTTDNFLNDPAAGYKKNSFQFVTGLTYTLP
jgi:hypothetical protein